MNTSISRNTRRTLFCCSSLPTFLQTMKHNQKYSNVNTSKPAAFEYKIANNFNFNHRMFNKCICLRKLMLYSHQSFTLLTALKIWKRSSWLQCSDLSTKWQKVPYPRTPEQHIISSRYSQYGTQYLGGRELYRCQEVTALRDEDRSFHTPPGNWNDCHCHHSLHTQILRSHQVKDYSTISGNNLGKGQFRMGYCTHL